MRDIYMSQGQVIIYMHYFKTQEIVTVVRLHQITLHAHATPQIWVLLKNVNNHPLNSDFVKMKFSFYLAVFQLSVRCGISIAEMPLYCFTEHRS